jgi:spore germination protein KA
VPAVSLGINGMVDRSVIERALAAIQNAPGLNTAPADGEALIDWLALQHSSIPVTNTDSRVDKLLRHLTEGHVVIFIRGARRALVWVVQGFQRRAITEPPTEGVVRGPREGFTENLSDNTAMVRRRVRDERLRIEQMIIGEVTGTRVALLYISGICRPELVHEVRERLGRIKTDAILDSGYIQEYIEDTSWTLFPLMHSTERPDVVAAGLLSGRFAILVDGSPFALAAPTTFNAQMQSPEDYYERFPVILLVRTLRWGFASVALLGPSFYVAFTTYHHEMLPSALLLSIMAAREGVPFPAVVEALMMEIAFEALREAGIRMPKQIGQAISIVGALVIGQAAVTAGISRRPW